MAVSRPQVGIRKPSLDYCNVTKGDSK
ncbi:hypothetical protein PLANTIT3_80111 [Plantibacter sp. T3]|nr:hypothetical protein PLANTIT3_80111 [Plantibacter sp. T3]